MRCKICGSTELIVSQDQVSFRCLGCGDEGLIK